MITHSLLCPKTATVISDICTRQFHIPHRTKNESQQISVIQICIDAGFLTTVNSDNISRQNILTSSYNLQSQ